MQSEKEIRRKLEIIREMLGQKENIQLSYKYLKGKEEALLWVLNEIGV